MSRPDVGGLAVREEGWVVNEGIVRWDVRGRAQYTDRRKCFRVEISRLFWVSI